MAEAAVARPEPGYITIDAESSAMALGKDVNIAQQLLADEDDSSLSSAGTEIFDRSSNGSSTKDKWQLDANGKWQRYGSLDSAPSTGISSMSSSVAAEDIVLNGAPSNTPSRKRLADGSVKPASPRPVQTPGPQPDLPKMPEQPVVDPQVPVKRKRGRPRKHPLPEPKVPAPSTTASTDPKPAPVSALAVSRSPKVVKPQAQAKAPYASRLDPYALHAGEHKLLADYLMYKEITVYLNIRNAILRLWTQNPMCTISAEEAAGCARESRFFGLADVAYRWLTRNGYINFGCVQVQKNPKIPKKFSKDARQRTVVVIGAGVSGLTTARQLESLFTQEASKWIDMGERPPRVIVLEGRHRVGGRVYSKPLRSQVKDSLPDGLRNTAEMGAMIITGFEHGNPLDIVLRGQLGLRYHLMKDALTIYDCDGEEVEEERDTLNTELYTDISDRAGEYRADPQKQETLRGDEELINRCRDPAPDGYSAFQLEPIPMAQIKAHKPAARRGRRRNAPPGTEKLTGRSQVAEDSSAMYSAARAAKSMGWDIKDGIARNESIFLQRVAGSSHYPTLGTVMDEAIVQYQDLIDLTPLDMRLLNWHHANLEYANAAPVSQLSLSGHDQDTGNEFEGAHSEVVGGYTQVPRGLMNLPTKLDVRFNRTIESIHYDDGDENHDRFPTRVVCTDGEVIEADQVVLTAPLGVLKSGTIDFDPPLPRWKQGAIDRMGFGLLNKVILLYNEPFWDDDRDMFGLLNDPEQQGSLEPSDYERRRGRFYLIWNATKISGRPMLIALMAGNAAHDAEWTETRILMDEVTARLRTVFTSKPVPAPLECIVTRWRRDPFARGTYSYVGPETRPGDYDTMARPVGNLHFGGEATCGTHPATVHGALLSGLRVASDVIDHMAGMIELPSPLVGPGPLKQEAKMEQTMHAQLNPPQQPALPQSADPLPSVNINQTTTVQVNLHQGVPTIKQEYDATQLANIPLVQSTATPTARSPGWVMKPVRPPAKSVCASDPSYWVAPSFDGSDLDYEAAIFATLLGQIGERPVKPGRPNVNPFIQYTKDKWDECAAFCAKQYANVSNQRNIVRTTLGKWWKASDGATKQPYLVQSQTAQELADSLRKEWEIKVTQWDQDAKRIKDEYMREHPPPKNFGLSDSNGVSKRKTNVSNCVVLDHV
ncbi:hypothetical protein DOTSEDRAFT_88470 [Dothistroma septosporum NZE10]|uniref:SWIRM domain-containing protein n=1 Tax=Dothistroma septosporum (strain NZE10 / CBS 128990) TaxID=675120 RepID=N1PL83_DOTSN|nr:hypothetical protein DOTSEDRAFT_88470 [Dothistroma septosporum NZE10]